jgi:hypothetical protein
MILTIPGVILFQLNVDLFFGLLWFFALAAVLSSLTTTLVKKSAKLMVWLCAFVLLGLWFVFNDTLFLLVSESVNSNPYGEYFLGQFEFRIMLSIFVLKAILKIWLTDTRLVFATLLLLIQVAIVAPFMRYFLMTIPTRLFEFVVHAASHLKIEARRYITISLGEALLNSLLWCLAAYLLQFDNFILMTFIMLLFSFIPRIGLFVGAVLSLLFVESGLFLIQLGGMLIALASMWFVDHTFLKDQELLDSTIPLVLLAALPVAGYFVFSFWGLFLTAPVVYLAVLMTRIFSQSAPLLHKSVSSRPRNA